jgi:superoxide oxidase
MRHAPAYSRSQIILHWLSAAVILWASCSGFIAGTRAVGDSLRIYIDSFNPQLTTLFIPFFLWRVVLYLRTQPWRGWRALPWGARFAAMGHGALYACISAVLASGFLMMPAPWRLAGVLPMPHFVHDAATLQILGVLHRSFCACLAVLTCGHLLAVLKHHAAGEPILNRMRLPAAARTGPAVLPKRK